MAMANSEFDDALKSHPSRGRFSGGWFTIQSTDTKKRSQPNMYKAAPHTIINARMLRKSMSDAEQLLWSKIRNKQLGVKFRRQVPIGRYIIDFYSYECQIAIELDGSQHIEQQEYDAVRTAFLEGDGITVLRFWNNDVLGNIDGVLGVILQAVGALSDGVSGEIFYAL